MSRRFKTASSAILLGLALTGPALAQDDSAPRTIVVAGEGFAAAVPDLAYVSIGVSHEALQAGDAMAEMSTAMTAVLAQLAGAGIAPTDIQTGQLTLEPRFDYSSADGVPKMLGYIATTMVEVRVRAIDQLGTVLDAVVDDGANRLGGIRFDMLDSGDALDDARRDAVADARARAELFADAAGVTLGDLISLSESGSYAQPTPMFDMRGGMEAEATSVPVAAGEISFTAMVTMVYAIE